MSVFDIISAIFIVGIFLVLLHYAWQSVIHPTQEYYFKATCTTCRIINYEFRTTSKRRYTEQVSGWRAAHAQHAGLFTASEWL